MSGERSPHSRWELGAGRDGTEVRAGHEEARLAYELGNAVRERRLALGLSQTELAKRAGMTQPALSRLEAGGPTPTIGVLDRLAHALGAKLTVTFTDAA
ncbi:helix-turn-helix domain-containing protein [Actinomadura rupiterrae]|uniref:helix-turn-helix domain-containing protein n=1 Tax=Actinomadura rupiterrae TaxID=559627 RepID=UPI0020A46ED4|nr:helix-turn-helix transcriptional regulator [Actinomadura rupiterrae]MCP2340289.1 ribosome-binding protein aMBF1 (putative translation factor) [Actinomadura rupiterrae]